MSRSDTFGAAAMLRRSELSKRDFLLLSSDTIKNSDFFFSSEYYHFVTYPMKEKKINTIKLNTERFSLLTSPFFDAHNNIDINNFDSDDDD